MTSKRRTYGSLVQSPACSPGLPIFSASSRHACAIATNRARSRSFLARWARRRHSAAYSRYVSASDKSLSRLRLYPTADAMMSFQVTATSQGRKVKN
jgi:hypothetical protein